MRGLGDVSHKEVVSGLSYDIVLIYREDKYCLLNNMPLTSQLLCTGNSHKGEFWVGFKRLTFKV